MPSQTSNSPWMTFSCDWRHRLGLTQSGHSPSRNAQPSRVPDDAPVGRGDQRLRERRDETRAARRRSPRGRRTAGSSARRRSPRRSRLVAWGSVYVVSRTDGTLVRFDRDTVTGALTPQGCLPTRPTRSAVPPPSSRDYDAYGVAVSPDGKSVYVASRGEGAIVRFDRNLTTGALTPQGCVADVGATDCGGSTQNGLGGAHHVTVSPDNESVYVAAGNDDAIVRFDRDTVTGALTPQGCISDTGTSVGCAATRRGSTRRTNSPSAPTASRSTCSAPATTRSPVSTATPARRADGPRVLPGRRLVLRQFGARSQRALRHRDQSRRRIGLCDRLGQPRDRPLLPRDRREPVSTGRTPAGPPPPPPIRRRAMISLSRIRSHCRATAPSPTR